MLVVAVPIGLGVELQDIRMSVFMWMIPALAMFLTSFLHKKIASRAASARKDYAFLLLGIGAIELLFACASLRFQSSFATVLLVCSFVFLYAFLREGIPRLLYMVSIYRYFAEPSDYSKISGKVASLSVLASLIGMGAGAYLVTTGSWRYALIFDSLTFCALAVTILFSGRDFEVTESISKPQIVDSDSAEMPNQFVFRFIGWAVPTIFGVNAVCGNYLALLADHASLLPILNSIALIAAFRLPGMMAGLSLGGLMKKIAPKNIIIACAALLLLPSLVFSAIPSLWSLCLIITGQGLYFGVFVPADLSIRNTLNSDQLIRFNSQILRRLALSQLTGCILAFVIYNPHYDLFYLAPFAIIFIASINFVSMRHPRVGWASPILAIILLFFSLGKIGFGVPTSKSDIEISLPALNSDFSLRPDLTYAAIIVLNSTSGHLFYIGPDLSPTGEVISQFKKSPSALTYTLTLSEQYRTARGHEIVAKDILFTIKSYLLKYPLLSGPFKQIKGAEACSENSCDLEGITILSEKSLSIELTSKNHHFIDELTSPWLLVFEEIYPLTERVGSCVFPAQTGNFLAIECDETHILLESHGQTYRVVAQGSTLKPTNSRLSFKVINDNPGISPSPTLTSLAVFGNPKSQLGDPKLRIAIQTRIKNKSIEIAKHLNLIPAPMMLPKWLGISAPQDMIESTPQPPLICPKSPIKILLDTSLPNLKVLGEGISIAIGCATEIKISTGDKYFENFGETDFGVAWFTPDFLDIYNVYSAFDCEEGRSCYFDWGDPELSALLSRLKNSTKISMRDVETALAVEKHLQTSGYMIPIAEMNWWIIGPTTQKSVHPAGLFQVRLQDFFEEVN
jgi:hypothetical protein